MMAKRIKERGSGMAWWGYLICLVIILTSVFMLMDMIKTFTAESSSIGFSTEKKYFKTAADIDFSMSQANLQLNPKTGFYEYSTTLKAVQNYDGQKNKYELLVNNNFCSFNECDAGYLKSEYALKFYNVNGTVDVFDTMFVNFQFFNNKTQITVFTKGNTNAVAFWKSYIANDGFNLKIIYAIR